MAILKSTSFTAVIASVILLGVVLVPIASAMGALSETPIESENDIGSNDYRMAYANALKSSQKIVISVDDGTTTIKIGSAAAETVSGTRTVITNSCVVTIYGQTSTAVIYESDGGSTALVHLDDGESITFNRSTWKFTHTFSGDDSPTTKTGTFSWIYYPSEDGELLHASAPIHVDSGATIVAGGATYGDEGRTIMRGTLDNLNVVISYYRVVGQPSADYQKDGYTNTLNSIALELSGDRHVTITDFIVPLEYTSGMEPSMTSSLVFLVPLLMAAALITAVAYEFVVRRERR